MLERLACALPGVYRLRSRRFADERGTFFRVWCRDTLADFGLDARLEQASIATNPRAHTLRGMHWQALPERSDALRDDAAARSATPGDDASGALANRGEAKIVRCIQGRVYDVVLDLRAASPSRGNWVAFELDAHGDDALYIPPGCAHGYLTLEPESALLYQMSTRYEPDKQRGVRWNDPAFGIDWPHAPAVISQRDATFAAWTGLPRALYPSILPACPSGGLDEEVDVDARGARAGRLFGRRDERRRGR